MKVYVAFQATAASITSLYLQSGGASEVVNLPAPITRGDGKHNDNFPLFTFY